jgi:hypothetical protein
MKRNGIENQRCLAREQIQENHRFLLASPLVFAAALAILLVPVSIFAQQLGIDVTTAQPEGSDLGNYHTNFNVEAGYRFTGINGNVSVYDTMVDLQSGPRILSEDLSMRAINHQGAIFDMLSLSGFGYGGDPNTATRLRMSKNKWYDFSMSLRHDINYFDYNVLANPLNPANQVVTINQSPHMMDTSRAMQDYDLVIAPQSRLRFRAGFNRVNNQGSSWTTYHDANDVLLYQPYQVTSYTYRFGADYKLFKATTLTYDQSFDTFKGNNYQVDQGQGFTLPNGTGVDIGLPYNPAANLPCKTPFINGYYNPACNGTLSYLSTGPVRSFIPTEQISMQSHDIHRLDLSAHYAYSSGYSQVANSREQFSGLVTRTNQLQFTTSGPEKARRVLADGDFGGTWHITDKWALSDTFRFWNSKAPGDFDSTGTSCFPNGATSLLSGIGQFNTPGVPSICAGGIGIPVHTSGSPADLDLVTYFRYQNLNFKYNTATLEYTMNSHLGAYVGYIFGDRQSHTNDNEGVTDQETAYFYPSNAQRGAPCTEVLADGTCVVLTPFTDSQDYYDVTDQTATAGLWYRPSNSLRINGNVQILTANGTGGLLFTRIEPRNQQQVSLRGRYTPNKWLVLSSNFSWQVSRNFGPDTDGTIKANNRGRSSFFGFDLSMTPGKYLSFDLGYSINNVYSSTAVCLNLGTSSLPVDPCYADSNGANTYAIWNYNNTVNSAYFNVILRPSRRVALQGGYNLVDSTGGDPLFLPTTDIFTVANPLQPLGSLSSLYHRPTASVAFALAKGWEAKGYWGYYDYHERGYSGPILPRNYMANTGTVSVKYSF